MLQPPNVELVSHMYYIIVMCSGPNQGRKSMFKHGRGDNIVMKYTSRLQDVSRGAYRRALLGGSRACTPDNFFKWCKLMRFGVYLDQILSLKNFENYYFLSKFFVNFYFSTKILKNTIFFIKLKKNTIFI